MEEARIIRLLPFLERKRVTLISAWGPEPPYYRMDEEVEARFGSLWRAASCWTYDECGDIEYRARYCCPGSAPFEHGLTVNGRGLVRYFVTSPTPAAARIRQACRLVVPAGEPTGRGVAHYIRTRYILPAYVEHQTALAKAKFDADGTV